MQSEYEIEYLIAEKTHPWFVYRRKLVFSLIKNLSKNAKILEIGCGSGINLQMLSAKGFKDLTGIEPSDRMKKNKKDYTNIKVVNNFSQIRRKFDLILMLDVLEHIKNDSAILNKLLNTLKKRGQMIITVPAFDCLWSQHDLLNQHYRRYTKTKLKKILKNVPVSIQRIFYWNFFLFLPIAISRIIWKNKKVKRTDITPPSFPFFQIYSLLLALENKLIKIGINPSFGVSLVVLLKKNDA